MLKITFFCKYYIQTKDKFNKYSPNEYFKNSFENWMKFKFIIYLFGVFDCICMCVTQILCMRAKHTWYHIHSTTAMPTKITLTNCHSSFFHHLTFDLVAFVYSYIYTLYT